MNSKSKTIIKNEFKYKNKKYYPNLLVVLKLKLFVSNLKKKNSILKFKYLKIINVIKISKF